MRSREYLSSLFELSESKTFLSQLHSLLLRIGLIQDSLFVTKLTSSYAKRASLKDARQLFDETPHPTVFLYNAILRAYCRENQWKETLDLFQRMNSSAGGGGRRNPDNFTVPIVLKAFAGLRRLEIGKAVHGFLKKDCRIASDLFVGAALVEMYAICGEMESARKVFVEFPQKDVVLWTSMVTGYQQNGDAVEALSFFSQMLMVEEAIIPDPVTLISVVSACMQLKNVGGGRCCHGFVLRRGFEFDLCLVNALLNFYSKVRYTEYARNLFNKMHNRDVISWSSMIDCYAQNGNAAEALGLFDQMIEGGIEPNLITVVSALQACAVACDLDKGRKIHDFAIQKDFKLDVVVSTALIDMYMKCSCFDDAVDLFHRMPKKDVVSWAALISGYAQNGLAHESLEVFHNMLLLGMLPDAVTVVKILAACSQVGVLRQALCLHGYLVSSGFDAKMFVGAALIDLYSKCGSLDDAVMVFEEMKTKDVVVWSSMIAGYGVNGLGTKAIKTFNQMVESSIKPNHVTFVSVLSACSHAGLVEEGIKIFNSMKGDHGVIPNSEHYGIVVDILGRKGDLNEAAKLIERMPVTPGPYVWGALLAGCRTHNNIQMGEFVAENLLKLDPDHAGYYVLLSNIYAVGGRWDDAAKVRNLMKAKRLRRTPGRSSIEVGKVVKTFLVDDRSHPESERIYLLMRELELKLREEGFVPTMHDVDETLIAVQ